MKAVAIKKGQARERAPALKEMGTLRCDGCGEEFIVFDDLSFVDNSAAAALFWRRFWVAEPTKAD